MLRTKLPLFVASVVAALYCLAGPAAAAGKGNGKWLIDDFAMGSFPKLSKPKHGVPFVDPVTHMTIVRVTDGETDGYAAGRYHRASGGYPKHSIENCDGTYLSIAIYAKGKGMSLYDAKKFRFIKPFAGYGNTKPTREETRWDGRDPAVIYYCWGYSGNASKFFKQNVETGAITLLHDFKDEFPGASYAASAEEGDSSADSRYWAFYVKGGGNRAIVCYDKDAQGRDKGKVISKLENARTNWAGMSPSGKYVILGETGTHYDREFKKKIKSPANHGHNDLVLDDEGREALYNAKAVSDLETGKTTRYPMQRAPYRPWKLYHKIDGKPASSFGYHVSGNSYGTPGWAVISTYSAKTDQQLIYYPEQSVLLVEVTHRAKPAPRVWRLIYHRSARKVSSDDPFAKANMAGTRVYYGSNWNNPGGAYDVYCVQMPDGWYEKVMGVAKAKSLREKAAKLTGLTVEELTDKKSNNKKR